MSIGSYLYKYYNLTGHDRFIIMVRIGLKLYYALKSI